MSDEANQWMEMIRRPWWSEASGLVWPGCRGYTPASFSNIPLLFFEGHPGIFNDHRESGPQINILSYSTVSPSLYLGVRPTHTTGWAPPAGLINTSSCSNLVYFSISIYAFSRCFYPKRLTNAFRLYIFISMSVPWESNPQPFAPFALLTQCSTTEPHRNTDPGGFRPRSLPSSTDQLNPA